MPHLVPFTGRRWPGRFHPAEPVPGRPTVRLDLGAAVCLRGATRDDEAGHIVALDGDRATVQTARARVVVHRDRLTPLGLPPELALGLDPGDPLAGGRP